MTKVVENIVQDSNGKIDLLLLTHQHWDHLSGFIQAEASFAKLRIGDVWVAWTEKPDDELAKALRGERQQALASLRLGVGAMRMAGDADAAGEVEGLLGFFGAAGGASTEDALAKAIGWRRQGALLLPHGLAGQHRHTDDECSFWVRP